MQLVLLFDVGMIPTGSIAAFTVVAAEDGGQLLLGHPVGGKGDGAFLCQASSVLHGKAHGRGRLQQKAFLYNLKVLVTNIYVI